MRAIALVHACAALFSLAAVFSAAAAESVAARDTTKVRSDGCAEGTSLASRDAAVLEARRNAVWLWLEMQFGQKPGEEFQPLFDYLDVYTASSRVVGVHTDTGQTCAELEVYLNEWPLRADTAALLFRLRPTRPSVAFLFIEEDAGAQGARKFQQSTRVSPLLLEAFRSKGFTIVDHSPENTVYSERELLSINDAGDAALGRYGVEMGADAVVAVVSKLGVRTGGKGASALHATAEVSVRVVSPADGRLFEHSQANSAIDCTTAESGYSFALPDAVYKMRDHAIVGAILAAHNAAGPQLRLTLEGVTDYLVAERIAQLLRTFPGVSGANVISVRGGAALIQFAYDGRMSELVDQLQTGGPGVPRLEVSKVVGTDLQLRVVPQSR